jgi:pimeloyl-ACP methyl ester carboxylesterase
MLDRFIHKFLGVPYRLHVRTDIRRDDEQSTMVFLHGVAASAKTWAELLEQLKHDADFANVRLISVDLLGFGGSPHPKWSKYTVLDHIRALRRTLGGLFVARPLYLVGHSMGSLLAAEYASRYGGVEGLVLVSPPFMTPAEQRTKSDALYASILNSMKKAVRRKTSQKIARTVEKFTNFESKYSTTPATKRSIDNVILKGTAWQEVRRLHIPIILVNGRLDTMVSRRNLQKLAQYSHISLAESTCGHAIVGKRVGFVAKQLRVILER